MKNMRKRGIYVTCIIALAVACTQAPHSSIEGVATIDVAGAMEKPTELKLSELGSAVRYIPLETTDSCLIGRNPNILLTDNHIVVFAERNCLAFNKADGKFIAKIGHVGEDPEAYSYSAPIYNEEDGLLYFRRVPNLLQKYDLLGKYCGKVEIPTPPSMPTSYAFIDSLLIGHYETIAMGYNERSLLIANQKGEQIDTVPSVLPVLSEKGIQDIASINVSKGGGIAGIILTKFKDQSYSASIVGIPTLWKSVGSIRFKEHFTDTVYTLERNELTPYLVFDTGKWHWGPEARTDSKYNEERLLIGCVFETEKNVFFQCIRGLYTNEPETYNGIYDRKKGTTKLYLQKKGITDDLTGFQSFHPRACSSQGEYAAIVGADKMLDWVEEHPEAKEQTEFASFGELTEDSNPVIILTIPHL